jgi:hypothetical protein
VQRYQLLSRPGEGRGTATALIVGFRFPAIGNPEILEACSHNRVQGYRLRAPDLRIQEARAPLFAADGAKSPLA